MPTTGLDNLLVWLGFAGFSTSASLGDLFVCYLAAGITKGVPK